MLDSLGDDKAKLRPRLVLLACCLSLFMIAMDVTIINVALPAIEHEFGAGTASLQWTIDAYTLVIASFLMLSGSMADRFGRKRAFQMGMLLFSLGSILCGVAPGAGWLIAARVVQAAGGTLLNPVALAILRHVFTDPRARARALGLWGTVFGVSLAAGPLAGGFLTETYGWRWIFFINVPFGILAIVLTSLFVPESRAGHGRRFDPVGQLLVIAILAALMAGVIEGPRLGWESASTLGLFAVSIAALAGLVLYEPRRHEPLLDLTLFRSVPFASATLIAVCAFAAFAAFLFLNAIYLQNVMGYSAFGAGLCTLPLAAGTIICPILSGRMVGRWGARPSLVAAGLATAVSAVMMLRFDAVTPLWYILTSYLIFGVGVGMVNPPITFTAMAGLPQDRAALAGAIASASRQTGASLGVALAGTIGAAGLAHRAGADFRGMHVVWALAAVSGLAVVALALISTSRWGLATTRHVAHLFAGETQP